MMIIQTLFDFLMADLQKTCAQNPDHHFTVTDNDLKFYDKISPVFGGKKYVVPPPTLCPDCRQQRRLAQGNQINLYSRKCDLTGAMIISNFRADSPYKVYRQEDWYSDKWDALQYGKDFDFSRPFFEQFQELSLQVPRPALQRGYSYDENADYTNYAGKNKNCYLIFDSDHNRDCYYSYSVNSCESCMDCFRVRKSELCYKCVDCVGCYGSAWLQDCQQCSDSMFLKNCTGCKNCLLSNNLKNKEYYVENKPVGKAEFERRRAELMSFKKLQEAQPRFEKLKLAYPQKFMHGFQNERVVGDYLTNCKNCEMCFDSSDLWDCKYVFQAFDPLKDSMDIQECGDGEQLYECTFCGYNAYHLLFCALTLGEASQLLYSTHCPHSKNLFGCIGVMRKQYCILNKQYSAEAYEKMVPRIIEHMQKTGECTARARTSEESGSASSERSERINQEWGEFFPIQLSTFAYNETIAQDYFPLTKSLAEAKGWQWFESEEKEKYFGAAATLPDTIEEVDESICSKILRCEKSGKHYKIIPQELELYRKMWIPLPHLCFFERHRENMALRNPRKLWNRACAKCGAAMMTSYAPERPVTPLSEGLRSGGETIYCESCYLKEVY